MKFYPGDMYIYQGLEGETVLHVRSNEGDWFRMFQSPADAANYIPFGDEHMSVAPDGVFIRHGRVVNHEDL